MASSSSGPAPTYRNPRQWVEPRESNTVSQFTRQQASKAEASTARKRSRNESSNLPDEDMIAPLKGRRKLKSTKQVALERSQHALQPRSPRGGDGLECVRSDPIETSSRRPRLPRSGRRGGGDDQVNTHSPIIGQRATLEGLQHRLSCAEEENAGLQSRLQLQDVLVQKRELALKQSMMLDMIHQQQLADKKRYSVQKELLYSRKEANNAKVEAVKCMNQLETEKEKCTKALAEVSMYRDEADHLQALNRVMEEDLDELRQIENEDAAHRRRRAAGLPPAYGSLDDENYSQPHLHKDSGILEVATFKRTIRAGFQRRLIASHSMAALMRLSDHAPEREVANGIFFLSLSTAVAEACNNLKPVLEQAHQIRVMYLSTELVNRAPDDKTSLLKSKSSSSGRGVHNVAVLRKIARQNLVCDRAAKLVIDLCWRLLSACELRPTSMNLSAYDKTRVLLAHNEIDCLLLEALRGSFTLNAGYSQSSRHSREIVWEFQHYLTQVTSLQGTFTKLAAGFPFRYLDKSLQWLSEQVEIERMNMASSRNALVDAARTDMGLDGSWEEVEPVAETGSSEVSSALDDTGSEWSEDGVRKARG